MKRNSNKKGKDLDPDITSDWRRDVAVAQFRHFTQHDCLVAYLYGVKLASDLCCLICRECDEENVETWRAYDADDHGFQILNVGEIVTSVPEEPDPVDDETDADEDNNNNESSKGHQRLTRFLC
ncbi:hypothetical protein TNCV_3092971 [Trichonephila clavipes]|uniref:Uncharacterized protein n=1 Tax=Trichonephila clavipes TaxID=2585209 RepID=A0A8X6RZM3_TRICX|nr:hypothetical protein TNCV_3092971 [Trichonephila clavipes]